MRVKKEYIVLAVIIAVLSLYIILRNQDETHYELPELVPVEKSAVTRLIVVQGADTIDLERRGDGWLLRPWGYEADKGVVDKMLDAIGDFSLVSLASEAKNYIPYDLDEDNRIDVEAAGPGGVVRKLQIGKVASTYRHTYVRLEDDHRVYQADKDIRRPFDTDAEKVREKAVVSIVKEEISGITLEGSGERVSMHMVPMEDETDPGGGEGEIPPAGPGMKWLTADSLEVDEAALETVINTLVSLKCDSYINDSGKDAFGIPLYTATLTGLKTVTVSIFEKNADGKYPAVSSDSEYPFLLSSWKAERIMKAPGELIASGNGE